MTHIPGPWTASETNEDVWAIESGDEERIAEVYSAFPDDARLIAAAPDLLAALKRIAENGNFDHEPEAEDYDDTESAYGNGMDVANWEAAQIARAAIAKAEGRQP